jgi:RNA polymerase sigma-70 factor, ECF subfamily
MTVPHPADEELVARIARGDREAFAALYARRRPDVYRFALHMSGSHAVAEDVVQEVFLAVIHQAARYSPDRAAVVPWLLGIARNHVRRWTHHAQRIMPLPFTRDGEEPELTIDADPLPGISRREDAASVRRALAALPLKYREVIVLCDMRELSYADAAAVLRCAVGTVRSRLHRGRARLAARLRNDGAVLRAPVRRLIV